MLVELELWLGRSLGSVAEERPLLVGAWVVERPWFAGCRRQVVELECTDGWRSWAESIVDIGVRRVVGWGLVGLPRGLPVAVGLAPVGWRFP